MRLGYRSLVLGWAVLFVLAACDDASAQQNRRPVRRPRRTSFADQQPAVSPMLSLLNPNVNPGANYAFLTAPMLQQEEANDRNAQSIRRLQFDTGEAGTFGEPQGIRATGHRTSFRNYSHYYGGGQAGAGGGGGNVQRRRTSSSAGGGGMGGMGGFGMGMY